MEPVPYPVKYFLLLHCPMDQFFSEKQGCSPLAVYPWSTYLICSTCEHVVVCKYNVFIFTCVPFAPALQIWSQKCGNSDDRMSSDFTYKQPFSTNTEVPINILTIRNSGTAEQQRDLTFFFCATVEVVASRSICCFEDTEK